MRWSFTLTEIFGIPIRLHLTFLLLLLFVAAGGLGLGRGGNYGVLLVLAAFACVVAHELAHSLVAQRLGVRVRAITLLPFGGVAQMERIPDNPRHEIVIAVVGPIASLALAGLCYLSLRRGIPFLLRGIPSNVPFMYALARGSLLAHLTVINVMLGVFNVLPAFPMDGGRVLRGVLALRLPYERATGIAVGIGQFFAVMMFVYGVFRAPALALIGAFIYLRAEGEERATLMRRPTVRVPVSRAMLSPVASVAVDDTLGSVMESMCHGFQQSFPVTDNGRLVGMLPRDLILRAAGQYDLRRPIRDIMQRSFDVADPSEDLDRVFLRMRNGRREIMPVARGDSLVGLISLDQIALYEELSGEAAN